MNIKKRYRWMLLDHKGRLKEPEYYGRLHPNDRGGGSFGSTTQAHEHLDQYIDLTKNQESHQFVLVTLYSEPQD
jgi:hypothetical protein